MKPNDETTPAATEAPTPEQAPERPIPDTLPTRNVIALLQHLRNSHIEAAYAINNQIEAIFAMGLQMQQEAALVEGVAQSYEG